MRAWTLSASLARTQGHNSSCPSQTADTLCNCLQVLSFHRSKQLSLLFPSDKDDQV
ncbi:hypothetical protein CY34DRAFT_803986 [Suillus luteus UH-Slu-Lm8-n1]|uniref:Uncharacterized protein n=1 Tax=Suillus luteus UH-Slu-Lm8-n1 TaxID=930992 RepID=A0A0D0BJ85_9AGAM|nr:hypothetical protein CY34DRAFT_803986 [Suillus luteus UH-Slu-Lm8-n1]